MANQSQNHNGRQGKTPYERAVLGFPNYWYPACGAREVGTRPKPIKLLGEALVFLRRQGKVYAIQDECPHRGALMSMGKYEFPGSSTITCRFHGFTYDVTNGSCVAALTDGPDSPVIGKLRIRTYPVEERKGIVWVWMGKGAPVPLEDDVPKLILRDNTMVKYNYREVYGNWRYHAELGADGHFPILHQDAIGMLFRKWLGYQSGYAPKIGKDDGVDDGEYLLRVVAEVTSQDHYPGLGVWPPSRWWKQQTRRKALHGDKVKPEDKLLAGLRLPGLLRSPGNPMIGAMYYEWYVAIDEKHYRYFQVNCFWPTNFISRMWTKIWYHLWAGPVFNGRFNFQDLSMPAAEMEFEERHGSNKPSPIYRPDAYPLAWIEMCNNHARSGPDAGQPSRPSEI